MKIRLCIAMATFLLYLTACSSTSEKTTTEQVSPLTYSSPVATLEPTLHQETPEYLLQATPIPTKSVIAGQVVSISNTEPKPLTDTVVRLARVFWNEQKTDGAFALEAGSSPSTITNQDGLFVFLNIEPADYVIVIGDLQGDHIIISEPDGKAKIFTAEPDKRIEVGELRVKLGH